MTIAVWIALVGALAALVGQWGTGRLFARLKAMEDRQGKMDDKVDAINREGSNRYDKIEIMYWKVQTRLTVLETIEGIHKKEVAKW